MEENELAVFVGKKIKEARKKKKLTQKELGERIGVKHNTISSYESGVNAPEQNAIFKIARVLEVKVDDFFPANEEGKNDLDRAVNISDENLDTEDLAFLNELLIQVNSLQGEERKRFMDNVRFAVEFHKKSNK